METSLEKGFQNSGLTCSVFGTGLLLLADCISDVVCGRLSSPAFPIFILGFVAGDTERLQAKYVYILNTKFRSFSRGLIFPYLSTSTLFF